MIIIGNSCTVLGSLYPISENENEFVFKKELIGQWNSVKNINESYVVDTLAGSSGKFYSVIVLSRNHENRNIVDTIFLGGMLVQISNWYFLDCKLDGEKTFSNKEDIEDLVLLKHLIFRISFNGEDRLEASSPDAEELIKLINTGKVKLDYTKLKKDDYLFFSKPEKLRKAVEALNKYPEVYKSVVQLVRSK